MSPPIYTPDGSEVSEIVLPDGSTASEVIGPDGNVVFEAGPDIPDSGIARWTYDNADTQSGTAFDVWNNNDATLNNGVTTGQAGLSTTYSSNESYSFDGTDDFVDNGGGLLPNTGNSYSVAFWFETNDASNRQRIFTHRLDPDIVIAIGRQTNATLSLFHNAGEFDVTTISDNTVVHVIAAYDNTVPEHRVYIDGSVAATGGGGQGTSSGTHRVGSDNLGSNVLDGRVDDVREYSKALSDTEASNLYNTGSING